MSSKLIAAAHEAKAIAAGDKPAAAIVFNGYRYVSADRIEALEAENERLVATIHWALGYTTFRERGEREGAYWWRKELRQRARIDDKIERLDAALTSEPPIP